MKQKFRLIYSLFSLIACAGLFINYSGGRDGNYAGAPSDSGTCANPGCHSGGSTTGSSVLLSNVPARYVKGQSYPLTLTIVHGSSIGSSVGGFQIVATNGASNAMIGSFTASSGTRVNNVTRLTHNTPKDLSSGTTSWTFNWNAPTTGAPTNVVFYYAVNAADGTGGTDADAILTGNSSTILPIELLNFTAKTGDNKTVNVAWKTASERNNRHFVLERSGDNQKFQAITQVKGSGTSASAQNYQFTDDAVNLSSNVIYYRLQQVDLDGTTTYSKVVSVDVRNNATLKIYPSLAKKGDVLQVETVGNATIEVLNINGQVVQSVQNAIKNGNSNTDKTTLTISTADLVSGRYFVRFIGNGLVKTNSFVVL
jgi:hypothetical protein